MIWDNLGFNSALEVAARNASLFERLNLNGALEVAAKNASFYERLNLNGALEAAARNASLYERLKLNGALEVAAKNASLFERLNLNGALEVAAKSASLFERPDFTSALEVAAKSASLFEHLNLNGALEVAVKNARLFEPADFISTLQNANNILSGFNLNNYDYITHQIDEAVNSSCDILSQENYNDYSTNLIEVQEFQSDLKDLNIQNENWQQRLVGTLQKWAKKNPVLAFIFLSIIIPILVSVGYDLAKSYLPLLFTKKAAHVREEPVTQSSIVCIIPPQQSVIVIEAVPYWLKIEFYPNDIDTPVEGWISKRSLEETDYVATPSTTAEESDFIATPSTTTCDYSES